MNAAIVMPELGAWGDSLLRLAVAAACLTAVPALTRRRLSRPGDQQALWRVAFVALLVLVPLELTGWAADVAETLRLRAAPSAATPNHAVVADDARVAADLTDAPSDATSWLAWVWVAGSMALIARQAVGFALLRRLRSRLVPLRSKGLRERMGVVAATVGCRRVRAAHGRSARTPCCTAGRSRSTWSRSKRSTATCTRSGTRAVRRVPR